MSGCAGGCARRHDDAPRLPEAERQSSCPPRPAFFPPHGEVACQARTGFCDSGNP